MAKKKVTMTVDEKIFSAFKHACGANAMKVSSKVELMMRDFLENYRPPGKSKRDGDADRSRNDQDEDGNGTGDGGGRR